VADLFQRVGRSSVHQCGRAVVGGIVRGKALALEGARRWRAISSANARGRVINLGAAGAVTVDGKTYKVAPRECVYIEGQRSCRLHDSAKARDVLLSVVSGDADYPTTHAGIDKANGRSRIGQGCQQPDDLPVHTPRQDQKLPARHGFTSCTRQCVEHVPRIRTTPHGSLLLFRPAKDGLVSHAGEPDEPGTSRSGRSRWCSRRSGRFTPASAQAYKFVWGMVREQVLTT